MRDQEVIIKFVKIVEKFPELYNPGHDSYRTFRAELTWDKIAERVRTELNAQCTVEEIKLKWKGIRSSYIRFKNTLQKTTTESTPCKKYYLYDTLKFLEPYCKPRLNLKETRNAPRIKKMLETSGNSDDEDSTRDELITPDIMDKWGVTVKSEFEDESDNVLNTKDTLDVDFEQTNQCSPGNQNTGKHDDKAIKRKCEDASDVCDNEDLHFFKSILPDIKDFSVKEKRKLKMGILQLIDEIEDNRPQIDPVHEVSSSKIKRPV